EPGAKQAEGMERHNDDGRRDDVEPSPVVAPAPAADSDVRPSHERMGGGSTKPPQRPSRLLRYRFTRRACHCRKAAVSRPNARARSSTWAPEPRTSRRIGGS